MCAAQCARLLRERKYVRHKIFTSVINLLKLKFIYLSLPPPPFRLPASDMVQGPHATGVVHRRGSEGECGGGPW